MRDSINNFLYPQIAGFQMSRGLSENETYYASRGAKTPMRLTAPEAISSNKFSSATDVWSYGCLLYEIWSFGHQPFEDFTETEVDKHITYMHAYTQTTCLYIPKVLRRLECGYRHSPPTGCPVMIAEIMNQCW